MNETINTRAEAEAEELAEVPTPLEMKVEPTTEQDELDLINTIDDEELRRALHAKRMKGRGRPRKDEYRRATSTCGYSRTSLIVNNEAWEKIKEIAFRETLTMKEIVNLAFRLIINQYEKEHGAVKPQQRQTKDINKIFNV